MIELSTKRIIVTGGAGFLGSHIVEALQRIGCRDIVIPRHWDYDLTRLEAINRLFSQYRPDIVIHAAAVVGGIGANRARPAEFFFQNAMMGVQIIDAAHRYGIEKLVVLGTICSYPKFSTVPFREEALWDGYPEETNAPYGIAKKALLVQCQAYRQQYGLNAIYLLPVNLYGPRDNIDLETSHVIPAMIRKCVAAVERGADTLECWGDGSPTREFLYVRDAAEGIIAATIRYDGAAPVNLGSGQEISIKELLKRIAAITGFRGKVVWNTSRPNGQPRRCLNVERAAREFGFRAVTPLDQGLSETVKWFCASRHAEVVARAESG
jgi:GDP-L-fucose synthase